MGDETIVITSMNCPSCDEVKKLVANKSVRVVELETPEGEALLKQCRENGLEIDAVPDCLVLKDGKARRCSDQEQADLLK